MLQLARTNIIITKKQAFDARDTALDYIKNRWLELESSLSDHALQLQDLSEHAKQIKEEMALLAHLANNHIENMQSTLMSLRDNIDNRFQDLTSIAHLFAQVRKTLLLSSKY